MQIEQLIEKCKQGDRKAQKAFYQKYYGRMMALCMRYARDRDQASEILNRGFLKIFQQLHKYDAMKGQFDSWIYRIMLNTAIDFIRGEIRNQHVAFNGQEQDLEDAAPDAISRLSAEEIIAMIELLPPAYCAVFNLYVIEGYSHAEIADLLGISEGTSRSNLLKARKHLQKMITEKSGIKSTTYAGE